jgi:hypothetical protein
MYIQHIQGFCQFRLSTADHALAQLKVKVKVTLPLTISQSVSLGVEPHL